MPLRPGNYSGYDFLNPAPDATGATLLLANYVDGIAISGDDGSGNATLSVKDSGTPANDLDNVNPQDYLTNGTTSPKLCYQSDGTYKWSPHNLLLYSDTLSSWTDQSTTSSGSTITASSGSSAHQKYTTAPAMVANAEYTTVAKITAGTHDYVIMIRYETTEHFITAVFDLNAGTVSETDVGTSSGTITTTGIVNNGDGSYTCYMTGSVATDSNNRIYIGFAEFSSGNSFGASGGVVWNAAGTETIVVENVNTYRGSYISGQHIPTTSAAVYGIALEYDADESSYTILSELTVTNLNINSTESQSLLNATETLNDASAPDGTTSAVSLVSTSDASHSFGSRNWATAATTAYVASCFLKSNGAQYGVIYMVGLTSPANGGVWFDLTNGTVGTQSTGYTGTIKACGNGWYLCSISFTSSGAVTGNKRIYIANSDGSLNSDTDEGLYVWGRQIEAGSVATSPIPTYGATASRDRDEITFDLSATPTPIDAFGTMCMVLDFHSLSISNSGSVLELNATNNNNSYGFLHTTSPHAYAQSKSGGTYDGVSAKFGTVGTTARQKWAGRFDTNNLKISVDGTASGTTDTSTTVPVGTPNNLHIGRGQASLATEHTRIYSVVILPVTVSDPELLGLSAP